MKPVKLAKAALIVGISFCCLDQTSDAAIYRGRDADGNIVFSDRPFAGGKEIDTPAPSRYTPPQAPKFVPAETRVVTDPAMAGNGEADSGEEASYASVTILSPKNDESIHENNGNFALTVALKPNLRKKHRLVAIIDGERQSVTWNTTSMAVTGIDRGTHKLAVAVTDESGKKVFAKSKEIEFHMHRASANFRRQQ